jgi:AcrR family transcriptional regulator
VRRPAHEAAATKAAIVEAARRAFAEHGYAATTLGAVAAAAGVTKGALYHHFADKRALFQAVFVELEAELDARCRSAAAAADTPLGAFVAGCEAWLDVATTPAYQRIAVVDAPAVLGVAEWHAIDTALGLATIEGGLRALHRAGLLAAPATPARAVVLFGALTEAGLSLARGDGPDRQALLDAFLALVLAPDAARQPLSSADPAHLGGAHLGGLL